MIIPNFLSTSECSTLINITNDQPEKIHSYPNGLNTGDTKKCWIKNHLNTRMRFALTDFPDLDHALLTHNLPLTTAPDNTFYVAKYTSGQRIKPHIDPLTDYPGALSVLVKLNDNYTGGNLYIHGTEHVEWDIGDAVIFNPRLLHSTSYVYTGTRYSLIFWIK